MDAPWKDKITNEKPYGGLQKLSANDKKDFL